MKADEFIATYYPLDSPPSLAEKKVIKVGTIWESETLFQVG